MKKWKDVSRGNAKIFVKQNKELRMTIVLGHILFKDSWILQTRPALFHKDNVQLFMGKTSPVETVQDIAEGTVRRRLQLMSDLVPKGE